jgi:hypothetical protein
MGKDKGKREFENEENLLCADLLIERIYTTSLSHKLILMAVAPFSTKDEDSPCGWCRPELVEGLQRGLISMIELN